MNVESSLEPPMTANGGDEPQPAVSVLMTIVEADDTDRNTRVGGIPPGDYEAIADAMLSCLGALVQLHGPGLQQAFARRLKTTKDGTTR